MRPPAPGILPSPPILRLDPAGSERDQLGHGPEIELLFDSLTRARWVSTVFVLKWSSSAIWTGAFALAIN
jgi:hypothetical protein